MGAKGRKGSVSALHWEGEMSIYQAADLKQVFAAALAKSGPLEIDLSAVSEFDTAGVQLLLAAKQSASSQKREFHVTAHSPAVLEVLEMLGLSTHFDVPVASSQS